MVMGFSLIVSFPLVFWQGFFVGGSGKVNIWSISPPSVYSLPANGKSSELLFIHG
jgi:hypothetical protein